MVNIGLALKKGCGRLVQSSKSAFIPAKEPRMSSIRLRRAECPVSVRDSKVLW